MKTAGHGEQVTSRFAAACSGSQHSYSPGWPGCKQGRHQAGQVLQSETESGGGRRDSEKSAASLETAGTGSRGGSC